MVAFNPASSESKHKVISFVYLERIFNCRVVKEVPEIATTFLIPPHYSAGPPESQ